MPDNKTEHERPTRRDYLIYGGGVVSSTLLAGCTSDSDSSTGTSDGTDSTPTDTPTATPTATPAGTEETETKTATPEDKGYSATISPVGTVDFESVPESVFTVFSQYTDMAVALGHGDAVNAMYVPKMAGTTMNHYYHHLTGVDFEWEGLYDPLNAGIPKEKLYSLDSDIHLVDPAWVSTQNNWSEDDAAEIAEQVAPWFGNFYSGTHDSPPEGYDDYEFYNLWELFDRVSQVFDKRDRYNALAQVHTDLVETIQNDLPPVEDRPTAVRVSIAADGESFYTYHLNKPGYWLADTRPLGAVDAFEAQNWDGLWGEVDFELMAETDPDVILHLWGITPARSMDEMRSTLQDHPVGRTLSAVKNDRVYAQGMRYQGPIMNLFQMEMTAKQLYPDRFGEWPMYSDGERYPDIPADEQLFNRQRVADIINGEN
ncbi:ABC transporter substrate-binding protein [Halovenus rubra]|uniref:ABC transporter substrate-binding protein n=2 Tax=Halovenus rubra TaxID=869890 RepID=A0ACC7DXN5_9EURY|nr:ABC transporter substrate-binding protein [Halovenus rubra]